MKRLDMLNKIEVKPWQTAGLLPPLGLTPQQTTDAAWFADAHGGLHRGAAAINQSLAHISVLFVPLVWLYKVPVFARLQNAAYAWVAANRHRLPGSTAACAIPKE